jgi:hypothetical protein
MQLIFFFCFLLSIYYFSTTCFGTTLPSPGVLTLTILLLFLILNNFIIFYNIFKIKKSNVMVNVNTPDDGNVVS